MARMLKVEGYEHLVRNDSTNAIINTNVTEYSLYMKRIQARHESSDKIRCLVKEINTLKIELREIKKLIKGKLI